MHFKTIELRTKEKNTLVNITNQIQNLVKECEVSNGLCHIFSMHTTGSILINENADDDVQKDILLELSKIVPNDPEFIHVEGNSDSHIKASLIGVSEMVAIKDGKLQLGHWQGIYFCEFDGPRKRQIQINILS